MKKLFSGVSVGALALSAVVVPATAFGADAGKQDLSVLEHRYQVNCVDDNIIGPAQCKALEAEIAKLKAPAKKPVKPAEEKKDVCEGIKPGDTGYNSCELKKKKTEEALVKAEREKMAKLIMDKIADKALADKVLAGQITIFDAQKQLNSYLTRGKVAVAKGTNDAEVKEALALKAEALGKNFLAKQIRASKKSSVANLLAMLNSALKPGERVQLSDVDARVKPAGTIPIRSRTQPIRLRIRSPMQTRSLLRIRRLLRRRLPKIRRASSPRPVLVWPWFSVSEVLLPVRVRSCVVVHTDLIL